MNRNPYIRDMAADLIGLGALLATIGCLFLWGVALDPAYTNTAPHQREAVASGEVAPPSRLPLALIHKDQ